MNSNASITASLTLNLPRHLLSSLENAAQSQGVSADHLVVDLLAREFDPLHQHGAGRCSLRTGLCSEGPTPLPLQQP